MERTWVKRNKYQIGIWDEILGQGTELLSSQAVFKKQWVIIVGETGIGKTYVLRQEYEKYKCAHPNEQVIFIDLKGVRTWREFKERVLQQPFFEKWVQGEGKLALFLDHVDESIAKDTEFAKDLDDYYACDGDEVLYRMQVSRHRLILRMAVQTCFDTTQLIPFFQSFWEDKEREDFFAVYQLLPYQEPEVAELLMSKGAEPERVDLFLQAIREPSVASFALKPEPLKMLIELDLQSNQHFPRSLPELYEQTCQRLCPNQSLETVSRIAANLVFTNRSTEEEVLAEALLSQPDLVAFLAARWACHHLNTDRILQLITHPLGSGKIVPQLYPTAAWMASMNEEIFERILETDPNVLFSIPLDHFRKKQKEKLIRKFLDTAQSKDLVYTNVNAFIYPYFKYDGLADLLRLYFSPRCGEFTRLLAMDIAKECKLTELAEDVLHIAFYEQKSSEVRWKAIHLYLHLTHPEEWKKCKPLLKDKDGLKIWIREWILTKLWEHNQISIPELIEELAEFYKEEKNLKQILAKSNHHQLIALFRLYLKEDQPSAVLERIIDQSFLYALNFLHNAEMKEVLLALIAWRYRQGKQIGEYPWYEDLRRKWIHLLLDPEDVFDLSQSNIQKEDFHQILIREQDQLFRLEDRDWVRKEIKDPERKRFWEQQLQQIENKWNRFMEKAGFPSLNTVFEKLRKKVMELDISDDNIVSSWVSFSIWEWQVLIGEHRNYQEVTERLYQVPELREKVITGAKRFLSFYQLSEESLDSSPYLVAGRMSFRILYRLCPEQLQKLPDSIWKAWRTLFVCPDPNRILNRVDQEITKLAAEKIPSELEERFFQLVDSEDRYIIIALFCKLYWSPTLEAGLFERLQTGKLSLDQYKWALYYLLQNQSKQTEAWVDSLLNHWNSGEPISRENMAIVVYCFLMICGDEEKWNQVLNLMYRDVLLGKEIVSTFIHGFFDIYDIYLKQDFQKLDEITLEKLYHWLNLHLDLENLKEDEYVYWKSSLWKEVILMELRYRKTISAYETIKRLAEKDPNDRLACQYWQWCETDYLYKTWVPAIQ